MKKIFVSRPIDIANTNAQCLNAKALLSRFNNKKTTWFGLHYNEPDQQVVLNRNVKLSKLMRKHLWYLHMVLAYQKSVDAIFYPGIQWMDYWGLILRKILFRKVPLIVTLEGLVGNESSRIKIKNIVGHDVFFQETSERNYLRIEKIYSMADHIIAISPFLVKVGLNMYNKKTSFIPLGIETNIFFNEKRKINNRLRVISVGTLYHRKRPNFFLELAVKYSEVDFYWYGNGELREEFIQLRDERKLTNLYFESNISATQLANVMRKADIFILCSLSEGVPKVTQEAAACGLPCIIFGHYEAHSVKDGYNGYVVWDDFQFTEKLGNLINNRSLIREMGDNGAEMAKEWSWDKLAPVWENKIIEIMNENKK